MVVRKEEVADPPSVWTVDHFFVTQFATASHAVSIESKVDSELCSNPGTFENIFWVGLTDTVFVAVT